MEKHPKNTNEALKALQNIELQIAFLSQLTNDEIEDQLRLLESIRSILLKPNDTDREEEPSLPLIYITRQTLAWELSERRERWESSRTTMLDFGGDETRIRVARRNWESAGGGLRKFKKLAEE